MIDFVRRPLISLLWFAACYQPSLRSGVPCSEDIGCPIGQTCAGGFCTSSPGGVDGGGTGSDSGIPVADKDGDRVADDKDNCPDKQNAEQFDEDGDKRGDACDLCPQVAGEPSMDGDGDGIGDVCDPRPTTQDAVVLYEGFHSGLPAAWGKTAHWTYMQGSVQATSPGNSDTGADGEWLDTPFTSKVVPPDNFTIAATVTILSAIPNMTGDHSAGVEVFDQNALNQNGAGVRCGLEHFDGSDAILFLVDDLNNPNLRRTTPYAWNINVQYRVTLRRQGSAYTCTVFGPGGATDTRSVNGTSNIVPRNTDDSVDIWVFGSIAQFASVQIVGPP